MSRKIHRTLTFLLAAGVMTLTVPQLLAQGSLALSSNKGSSVRLAGGTYDSYSQRRPSRAHVHQAALFTADAQKQSRDGRPYASVVRPTRRGPGRPPATSLGGDFAVVSDSEPKAETTDKAAPEPAILDPHAVPLEELPPYGHDPVGPCGCGSVGCGLHYSIFAEFIYLRPGNSDLIYTVEQTGPDPVLDSPTGPVGRAAINESGGARIGLSRPLDECTSIVATYSYLESEAENRINSSGGNILLSEVFHPSLSQAGSTSNTAFARYEIDFQKVDLDFRRAFRQSCYSELNYSVGLKYANLDQQFLAQQVVGTSTGLTTLITDVSFDGFGIGFGLDGERRSKCNGWLAYAKCSANFLGGEFQGRYLQTNQLGGALAVANQLEDYRIVSILNTELGIGWQNRCGNIRWTAGYLIEGWFNTMTMDQYIQGVNASQFDKLSDTLTFNGLTTRLEYRY